MKEPAMGGRFEEVITHARASARAD